MKRITAALGNKDMRQVDAGDIQRLVSRMSAEGLTAKTIRNLWGIIRLVWDAALAQKYVDSLLPKPKLPKRQKAQPRFFTISDVAKMVAASMADQRVFYWMAAETGLRAGELAGLRITDIDGDCLTVNRSVWHGKEQSPKTPNAIRQIAMSPQLVSLVWEQLARQKAKGHDYLFTSSTGTPWDLNLFRKRKLSNLLVSLEIPKAGFHAFRHFNVSLLDSLRAPLLVIQERAGHALTGSFTLDVYGTKPEWKANLEAGMKAGTAIEEAVQTVLKEKTERFVSLTAIKETGLQVATL